MAVTILERPKGYILDDTPVAFTSVVDSSGDAALLSPGNTLNVGDIIYITSTVEDYNGFYEVVSGLIVDTFRFADINTGVNISYINDASGEYFPSTLEHGWSAVHLPITYRLSSDLYPTNSVDTTRNINSVQDANGYTVLQLSGSLGTVHTYDFVKLTLPNDTDLSAVYQILEFISPTVVLINLEYDTVNNFTGATALKHYNNYNLIVRVYAGINATHTWTAQKPYELAATLLYIPDDNNEAFFSINELLKSYIETRNNLLLGTLPNNIDFWTNFYIEVAESYDDSDGYVFGTYTSSYYNDQSNFEGVAVNAKLEFKNIYSGYLSAYLMTNNTAKFLTLFTIPILFSCGANTPDCYTDASFLNPDQSNFIASYLRQEYYLNGNLGTTVNDSITGDYGVIRMPLTPDCAYDRVDIVIIGGQQLLNEPKFNATGNWLQTVTASQDWTIAGGQANVSMVSLASSEYLYQTISGAAGSYRIITSLSTTDGGLPNDDWQSVVHVYFLTGGIGGAVVKDQTIGTLAGAAVGNTPTIDFDQAITVGGAFDTIAIRLLGSGPYTDSFTGHLLELLVGAADQELSETKEFKIDCGCSTQEIRLTWLNNLGGFDYWTFTAKADDIVEIQEAMTTKKNILPTWPNSYGADADTIKKQTLRISNKAYTVRSQFLTEDQLNAISFLESSILVQIINSRNDRRTVLVGTDSFIKRKDGDKTHEIAFNISFTDDIAVQTT